MTAATEDFEAACAEILEERPTPSSVWLPHRLAIACTRILPVADAGIIISSPPGIRFPIGVSSPRVLRAERLEFSVETGPSLKAQQTGVPVRAPESVLAQEWPIAFRLLREQTPFRAMTSIPLSNTIGTIGTLDLYFTGVHDLSPTELVDAIAVSWLITRSLDNAALIPDGSTGRRFLTSDPVTSRNWVFPAVDLMQRANGDSAARVLGHFRRYAALTHRTVDAVACDLVTQRLSPSDFPASPLRDATRAGRRVGTN